MDDVELRSAPAATPSGKSLLPELAQGYPAGAYLLTWNPASWKWDTLAAEAAAVQAGRSSGDRGSSRWSCGENGQIKKGARLFLTKQGTPPRGVIATAWASGDVFEDAHWDPQRSTDGDKARYVPLKFDTLIDPAVVPPMDPQALPDGLAGGIHWSTMSSGIAIEPVLVPRLERAWREYLARAGGAGEESDAEDFLGVLSRYQREGTIFQSTSHGSRYRVRATTADACEVDRVDGSDPDTCTLSSYKADVREVADNGGSLPFNDLGSNVAKRMTFLQSRRFGLSPDKERVLDLSNPSAALENFCAVLKGLRVDPSGGPPALSKPVLVAAVIEGLEAGDLAANHITFDWVLPRFLAKAKALGVSAGPEQAAQAFYDLTEDQCWMLCYADASKLIESEAVSPEMLRRLVSHAIIKDTYWRPLQDHASRLRALAALAGQWWPTAPLPGGPPAPTRFWWVNQGRTYSQERELGVIWAPQKNDQGNTFFHWTNVSRVRTGDVVFSYADGAIRSVSVARTDGHAGPQPKELAGHAWAEEGWTADLDYYDLPTPVPLASIAEPIGKLKLKNGPVNAVGGVNQAYLFELTPQAAGIIAAEADLTGLPESLMNKLRASSARTPRYWALSLGAGAQYWDECYKEGIAVVGGDFLKDFRSYATKEDFLRAIGQARNEENPVNDALMCYQFCYDMRPGDYVFAKIGRDTVLGVGLVESDYLRDDNRPAYKNLRRVRWLVKGELELPSELRVPLKTLTDVTDFTATIDYVRAKLPWEPASKGAQGAAVAYTLEEALAGLFVPREDFISLLADWRRKKNAILQGPPGVGKTFIAKRLAYALMGVKDPARLEMVQFHQSYAYEDFVQGWRPKAEGGFYLKNGLFYEFCRRAARDPGRRPHVFIIDEINRGNLSRILGELMLLIEPDHRGEDFAIPLTYSKDASDRFSVPENVYLLGMMNTADRSLAMVDYALRRRFCFTQLRPAYGGPELRQFLLSRGVGHGLIDRIVSRMVALNEQIALDKNLGKGFQIGHSFFCPIDGEASLGEEWYEAVIEREIAPLVREYWFDDLDRAQETIDELLE